VCLKVSVVCGGAHLQINDLSLVQEMLRGFGMKGGNMALKRTNPLMSELPGVTGRLSRLLGREDLLEHEGISGAGDWAPPVDILETDRELTIKAELPGIEAKDVSISLDNNVLTIKGERKTEKEISHENYHRMERAYGSFYRSFSIPAFVDVENAKAEFRNGLLTITLPKKDSAKGRSIEVNAA
jgi:HSP20 family protein